MIKRLIFLIAIIPAIAFSLTIQAIFECFFWILGLKQHPPIFVKLIDWLNGTDDYEDWAEMYK